MGQILGYLAISTVLALLVFELTRGSDALSRIAGRYAGLYKAVISAITGLGITLSVQLLSIIQLNGSGKEYYVLPFSPAWANILQATAPLLAVLAFALSIPIIYNILVEQSANFKGMLVDAQILTLLIITANILTVTYTMVRSAEITNGLLLLKNSASLMSNATLVIPIGLVSASALLLAVAGAVYKTFKYFKTM